MKKTYLVMISILIISILATGMPTTAQTVEMQKNKDVDKYTCIDRVANVSPPPDMSVTKEKKVKEKPLCSEGKVPKSLIYIPDSENKLKRVPGTEEKVPKVTPNNPTCYFGGCYDYATSYQYVYNTGSYATISQHSPFVNSVDDHSLAEISVSNTNYGSFPGDTVEVGWVRVPGDVTRLFTFWWLNGVGKCYDDCGWVQYSYYQYPGMSIPTSGYPTIKPGYFIEYYAGNWWIAYNGEWIGYYPGYLWNGAFNNGNLVEYFGEVAHHSIYPTNTQMGNGQLSGCYYAARIENQEYIGSTGWTYSNTAKIATSSSQYSVNNIASNAMKYGGPILFCTPPPPIN